MAAFVFLLSSIVAVVGAVFTVSRKNPVYSLLFLLVSFAGAAGVFYSLNATFVAISQIIVYAGAVAVLFLFVLMFVDLKRKGEEALPERVGSLAVYEPAAAKITVPVEHDRFAFSLPAALVAMALFAMFGWVIGHLPQSYDSFATLHIREPEQGPAQYFGSLREFGKVMMLDYPLHFEVVGLVILIGVMGAVMLGRNIRDAEDEVRVAVPKPGHAESPHDGHDHAHEHGHGHDHAHPHGHDHGHHTH